MTNLRFATIVVIATAFVGSVAGAQTPGAAPAQTPAPPADGVYQIGRDRIAPPRVLKEVRPAYTPEAMRNRVQGRVRLQGVVERDGTISGITVIESLDPQFGLDQSAISALKQWTFQPGTTVDGTPVRVLITVDLTFALRDETLVRAWPDGFSDASPTPGTIEEVAETQGLRLKVRRPADWTFRRTGPPTEWAGLRSADGLAVIAVVRPEAVPFELSGPASNVDVARVAELVSRLQPSGSAETLAVGQVQSPVSGFWIWSALRLRTPPNPPGTTTETTPYAEGRAWTFARTVDGRIVLIQCTLLLPRGLDPAAMAGRIQRAAAEFSPIISSVQFETVQ